MTPKERVKIAVKQLRIHADRIESGALEVDLFVQELDHDPEYNATGEVTNYKLKGWKLTVGGPIDPKKGF